MTGKSLYTFAARDDDRDALVLYLFPNDTRNLGHVLGQRHHHTHMLRLHAQAKTDGFELVGAGRVLSARHACGQVVGDDDGDVGFVVHGIQESGHAAVGERRVADDGNSREESGIGSAFGHRDACSHVHTRREALEGRQCSERIATDVAKHTMVGIVGKNLVQCGIDIPVSTTLTELWRTRCHVLGWSKDGTCRPAQCLCDIVRRKLARTRQVARETSFDRVAGTEQRLHQLLNDRLSVLDDHQLVALSSQSLNLLLGQRVLRHLEQTGLVAQSFADIIVGNATSQNATFRLSVSLCVGRQTVIGALFRSLLHGILLLEERHVLLPGNTRQEHPLVGGRRKEFLGHWFRHFHGSAGMSQARHDTQNNGLAQTLRQVEAEGHHVVSLLLIGGLQTGHKGELGIEARVLLVLRRVHRRVVCCKDDESALHAGNGAVDEGIGTNVHANMLHADQCTFTCIRHAESRFHGGLLVGAPARMQIAFAGKRMVLYKFCYFGAWRSRIGIHAAQSGVDGSQGNGLIT